MPAKPDYEALFAASPDPYLLLDRQLNIIIDANEAGVTRIAASDVAGQPVCGAFPEHPGHPPSTNVAPARVLRC